MSGFNFQGCVFIEGLSNAALQVADAKPGDCRNGNHVSEGQIVLWYHIFRQQIRELCTGERKENSFFPPNKLQKYAHIKEVQMHENEKLIMPLASISEFRDRAREMFAHA